jgi:hypothetical protein
VPTRRSEPHGPAEIPPERSSTSIGRHLLEEPDCFNAATVWQTDSGCPREPGRKGLKTGGLCLLHGFESPQVDQRGRYLNLPASSLMALKKLARGDFTTRVRELHELAIKSKEPRIFSLMR